MNVFQLNYDTRLQNWYNLRQSLLTTDLQTKCIEVDKWWQSAPLVNHYLHPYEVSTWPGPWDLINDNEYCYFARGLGMVYTLLLLGVTLLDFCVAIDDNSEEVVIVLVDNAKYVLNYWPNSVLNITQQQFKIVQKLDLGEIKIKL
jgi:hypothetical protein